MDNPGRRPQTPVLEETLGVQSWAAMSVRIAVVPLSFAIQLLGARSVGAAEYGRWQALIAVVDLLCFAAKLGLDSGGVRFAADYHHRALWSLLNGLHRATLALGLAASLVLGSAWLLVSATTGSRGPLWSIALGALLVVATVLLELAAYLLRGLERQVLSGVLLYFVRHCGMLALLGGAAMGIISRPTVESLVVTQLASTGVAGLVAMASLWRTVPPELRHSPTYALRSWLHVSVPLWVVAACFMLQSNAGLLIVAHLAPPEEAGAFAAAQRLASFVSFGGVLMTITLTPRIAAAFARRDRRLVHRFVRMTARFSVVFGTLLALAELLGSRLLLTSFGSEFAAHPQLLYALLLSAWVACWGQGAFNGLSMTGAERPLAVSATALTVSSLVLMYWATHVFGAIGAATAAIVNATISLIVFLTVYRIHGRAFMQDSGSPPDGRLPNTPMLVSSGPPPMNG